MIHSINGTLTEVQPTRIVVEACGVGYELNIPLSSFDRLPATGSQVTVLAHLVHRDDQMKLYGFLTEQERALFRMLISVSGVGPRVGLSILSGITVENFNDAVQRGDVNILKSVKGIGPKTASRLMLELKEKIDLTPVYAKLAQETAVPERQQLLSEAIMALISLGYTQSQAYKAISTVVHGSENELSVEEMVKRALQHV